MMEFRRSQWKWIRRETYFELSGRIEKAVEARSTGVKPPTTSTTSVEASITPMKLPLLPRKLRWNWRVVVQIPGPMECYTTYTDESTTYTEEFMEVMELA